jgi:GAF domain-containing protein
MTDQQPTSGNDKHRETTVLRRVDDVTSALEQLADLLGGDDELEPMLHRVCQQVTHAIPGADMASVSLLRGDVPYTAAVTDEHALSIDHAQYEAGQGPCLQAARSGEVVRVSVAEVRDRWPEFVAAADGAEVASYLSAPLFIDREYHGSLNLYGHDRHGFGQLDAKLLELYTTAVEAALRTARRYMRVRETTEQLRTAMTSRAVIDQAKGILMAVRRIPADEAFAVLAEQSQQQNVKVRVLAERFVANIIAAPAPDGRA